MSWETRNKEKRYFYKTHRVNGKVVRQYFGRGPIAELFAIADKLEAQARAAERAELNALEQEFNRITTILDRQAQLLKLLTEAHLIAAGYYNHKGQWRKRHEKNL